MESEKVKEIKKALEHCAIHDCSDSCIFSEKHPFACLTEMHKQLSTLINELESENEGLAEENERLKNCIATLEYKLDAKESYYNAVKDRAFEVFVQKIKAEIPDESTFGYLGYNGVMEVIDETLMVCLGK